MMTDDRAARLALRYLRELSPAIRDAAVIAADGTVIAGRSPVADPGRGVIAIRADAGDVAVVACVPAGPTAELARLDAATAAVVVRGRC